MSGASPAAAAAAIVRHGGVRPRVGLVLGSGLGGLADAIGDPVTVPYAAIPGFRQPRVEGHAGRLLLGRLAGVAVACLQGRVHLFEGAQPQDIRLPVRTLRLLGCEILLLTNAAGSLRPAMGPGSIMMLTDHINMQPGNPLVGPNDDDVGPRFPAMDDAYDRELQAALRAAAAAVGVALHEGVYLACLGPGFETPAEIRAFARLGADAVGMSTVPEVIVARHCGLRVAALSVVTNLAGGLGREPLSHDQTLAAAAGAADAVGRLIAAFLGDLGDGL